MKRLCFFLTLYFLNSLTLNAQWLHFCQFPVGTSLNPTFGDADFISIDSGIYYLSNPSISNSNSILLRTFDEAGSWNFSYTINGTAAGIYKLFTCRKQKTIYIVESLMGLSTIKKTDDCGISWSDFGSIPSFVTDLFTCDTNKVYAIYKNNAGNNFLYKYDNGIKYYQYAFFNSINPLNIFFSDTTIGYITAYDSLNNKAHLISKTTDGGINWNSVFNDTSINIRNIYFITQDIGYAIGDSGKVIKTINGGQNWQYMNTGTSKNLKSVYFLTELFGFAAGDSGVIIRTIDGGINWSKDSSGTTEFFRKIFFVNDSIGYALVDWNMYRINLNSLTSVWDPVSGQQNLLSIYPNPANIFIYLRIPEKLQTENNCIVNIFNSIGKLVRTNVLDIKEKIFLDVSDQLPGLYFISLYGDSKSYYGKFILN